MYIKPETTIKQTSASLLAGSNCYCDPHPHHHGGTTTDIMAVMVEAVIMVCFNCNNNERHQYGVSLSYI